MSRDRDVRNAIQTALQATDAFSEVYLWGLPEDYGSGASQIAVAVIEPHSSTQADHWDGGPGTGLVVTSVVTITLIYRHEDPQLRDEAVELLLDVAANTLNGQSLASLTLSELTRFTSWRWETPSHPERRISATFSYQYIVDGWADYDTSE
ncbi:MAG: hypothetical protein ACYDCP_09950 [Thermoplasmataceae archaeon]